MPTTVPRVVSRFVDACPPPTALLTSYAPPASPPSSFATTAPFQKCAWIITKTASSFHRQYETETETADEEAVVRDYRRSTLTITDDEGVCRIVAFDSEILARAAHVVVCADPEWSSSKLREVRLPRLLNMCDFYGAPRVILVRKRFFFGIDSDKM